MRMIPEEIFRLVENKNMPCTGAMHPGNPVPIFLDG
jgi:hypothetical protein